jgi:hypothetical protein
MCSAFSALALTGRLDLPSITLFAVGLGVSAYRTVKSLPAPLSARGAFVLSCGYILFFLLDMFILSGSFIPASIHLVLFLQLAKLYQEKTDKDYLYLIILSFLQILAASSLTIDISFVATLFLFLVSLVSTLMSFDMYRSEQKNTVATEHVAAPLSGMSLWAAAWIVLTGVVLFLVIPRVGTGYFTRAASQSLLISGFTDSVQLGDIGQVKLSSAVVMHARQISGSPFAVLKWRGIALDRFDGHNWYKTDRRRQLLQSAAGEFWIHPVDQQSDVAQYEMLLEPLATNTLFGPHEVRAVFGRLQGVEYDADDSIYLRVPTARRTQYQVISEIPKQKFDRNLPPGAKEPPIPSYISAKYLQLPRNIDPRIAELAKEITAKGNSTLEKASLVEVYLKRNYKYTLSLTWRPGPQPVSTFLFDAKSGHCEYFASAMVILLRAAGIPTRLINGFQMGEYNPVGGDYIVRQSDAHTWTEVYVPGRGWVEFDPTPPDPNHREMSLALQISQYLDAVELFWNSYIIVYDTGSQMQLFRSAQENILSVQTAMRDKSDKWVVAGQQFSDRAAGRLRELVENWWFWTAAMIAGLGLLAYKYGHAIKMQIDIWRLRRGGGAINEDVVEELFYRAARLAQTRAPDRRPAQTWREWIFGLPDPTRRSILAKALAVFEKSKYGRMPASSADFALLEETIKVLKS